MNAGVEEANEEGENEAGGGNVGEGNGSALKRQRVNSKSFRIDDGDSQAEPQNAPVSQDMDED